jgi:hypothetical protein
MLLGEVVVKLSCPDSVTVAKCKGIIKIRIKFIRGIHGEGRFALKCYDASKGKSEIFTCNTCGRSFTIKADEQQLIKSGMLTFSSC